MAKPWLHACASAKKYGGEDESDDEALCDAIDNAMEAFDDDDLEIIFGDHAKVVVTKTKITVEEYEHD